jgi:hypothetical protein
MASGIKCGPHGGKNSRMKLVWWTVSWLSHETKVEPGLRGSQVIIGDCRRLHQVRAAWWQEQQNEVGLVDDFLVEPQNQGRAGTSWEPIHHW